MRVVWKIMVTLGLAGVLTLASAATPNAQTCATNWFFSTPTLATCPTQAAITSQGSFMQFENGFMIWVGSQDSIFVLYVSEGEPRWQMMPDTFEEGMPEIDRAIGPLAPAYTFQPRRGMGLVWRGNEALRTRLGWAVAEYEFPYEVDIQPGEDGTLYVRDWRGGVFALAANGTDWARYDPQ